MPHTTREANGLEDLPHSRYGVQPIWRISAAEAPAVIEFGPPRLARDVAGPTLVEVPPEERIHSLAWLQRAGAITSEELEHAVERLLSANTQAAPIAQPAAAAKASAPKSTTTLARRRRVLAAYVVTAVIFIVAIVAAGPLLGRYLFARPSAVQVLPAQSPTAEQPSPSPSPSAVQLNLQAMLIKPSDLRAGYKTVRSDNNPLCGACLQALYSRSVGLQNAQLHRALTSAAGVAPSADDSHALVQALTESLGATGWAKGKGIGDESFLRSASANSRTTFYVVWRSGVITGEIVLIAPQGSLTLQSAIDLAKIQQARMAAAKA